MPSPLPETGPDRLQPPAAAPAAAPTGSRLWPRWPRLLGTWRGRIGAVMLAFVLIVALLGPLLAPHPLDESIGVPGTPPDSAALLGTDFLGRDVLSRLLHGGAALIAVCAIALAITYLIGATIGMLAGLWGGWSDSALMRLVDLFMVFPALLLILVLISGAGTADWVLVLGIVLVLFPGVARITRAATQEVSTTGYVEAAVARGENVFAIMRREILPNIAPTVVADAGVRFLGAIFLVASLNFLGFGSPPPAANWALMIAENRDVMSSNLAAVVAPAVMLGLLTISVNLVGDAFTATSHRSGGRRGQ